MISGNRGGGLLENVYLKWNRQWVHQGLYCEISNQSYNQIAF